MATETVYRVQPVGMELGDHRSETSNDDLDRGVHVFSNLDALWHGVYGWCSQDWAPEIVEIECDIRSLSENGDYEGLVLVGNRGRIVKRTAFGSWDEFADKAREIVNG